MIDHGHSAVVLPDGAKLAYQIYGTHHLSRRTPIVLIGGMSSLRGDWERLTTSLATERPVLVFDHRGMGDSTFSPDQDDVMTIESLARDALFLFESLQWKEIIICGFSMGGVITQQLLFLPYHPSNPTTLPFRVTHVLLTGTFEAPLGAISSIGKMPRGFVKGLSTADKRELIRPFSESTFDPTWVSDPANLDRLNWWLDRLIIGRPVKTILKQLRALNRFDFTGLHEKVSRNIPILVIHGELDQIVPYECGEELLRRIPWARRVEVGTLPGQVESRAFGHHWFEYFDVQVWHDVIEKFLGEQSREPHLLPARL